MHDSVPSSVPTREEIQCDLRALFRGAITFTLEFMLEEMVKEMIGARRYERIVGRRDRRNGSYLRELVTSLGTIEVRVPRTRHSGSPTEVLGRYRRRTDAVDRTICAAYVRGVSTRGMAEVTRALLGRELGRSSVSRITARLAEHVEALRTAPIDRPVPYLFLDATFLDARWARSVENVSVLVAYGIDEEGYRRLLAITIGPQESEESWHDLLAQLLDRGLHGVRLVVADAHRGLANAVRKLLPEVPLQRCTVHLSRNVAAKVPRTQRARIAREAAAVLHADGPGDARKRLEAFRHRFARTFPEAVEVLEAGFAEATRYFQFPPAHWRRIRSTNGLERLHREIKRRTSAVGAFPDRQSALRLVTAVALHATKPWDQRRYLDMTLLDQQTTTATR